MHLKFASVSSIEDVEIALALFELFAFAADEALFSEVPIAFDTILEDAQANPERYGLNDELDVLVDEPNAARQLLEELMLDQVFELMDAREQSCRRNYLFERVPGSTTSIRRKNVADINAAAYATAWLSFFSVFDASGILDVTKEERRAIRRAYSKVFELVALMACTQLTSSVGWLTGRSWTTEGKVESFQAVCDVVGYGLVKPVELWEETNRQANDAGADGFVVTLLDGIATTASIWIALGATIQKNSRSKKVMGLNELRRLDDFFVQRPTVAVLGASADPYPFEAALSQDYARADCLYLHRGILWSLLERYEPNFTEGNLNDKVREVEKDLKTVIRAAIDPVSISINDITFRLLDAYDVYEPAA